MIHLFSSPRRLPSFSQFMQWPVVKRQANAMALMVSCLVPMLTVAASGQPKSRPEFALRPLENPEAFEAQLKQAVIERPPMIVQYSTAAGGASNSSYSTTNLQESGVDEPDVVKYNGQYLFALKPEIVPFFGFHIGCERPDDCKPPKPEEAELRVFKLSGAPSGTEVQPFFTFKLEKNERAQGLLIEGSSLALISEPEDHTYNTNWQPQPELTAIRIFDISQPEKPKLKHHVHIEGGLKKARTISGTTFFVLSTWPFPKEVHPGMEPSQYAKKINDLSLEQLIPKMQLDGKSRPLFTSEQCLERSGREKIEYIQVILSLNLNNPASVNSLCLMSNVDTVYASRQHLYLTENIYPDNKPENNQLLIHQFGPNASNATYQGTAKSKGWLSGGRSSFRLSDYKDSLRVVVDLPENEHKLYTFSNQAENFHLKSLAEIPNAKHPTPLGKPGEQIYSVRYQDDLAYIVTFKRIDPLYKIDLSSPHEPRVLGKLEIPGYSDYLHTFPGELLLGAGYEVNEKDRRSNVKIALFNIAGKSPEVLKSLTLDATYTELSRDHHALSCLYLSPEYHCVFPTLNKNQQWSWQAFTVNTEQKSLATHPLIDGKQWQLKRSRWLRSIIHNDHLILSADGRAFMTDWPH